MLTYREKSSPLVTGSGNVDNTFRNQTTGAITGQTQTPYEKTRRMSWMKGWDVDNYHARKKRGELLPHTPFDQFVYSGEIGTCDYRNVYTPTGVVVHEAKNAQNGWLEADPSAVGLYAFDIPDLYGLVQDSASKIYTKGHDSLTFLAELKKTATMFTSLAQKVSDFRLLHTKDYANAWLEARYGWRTLWYDAQDLHSAFSEFDELRTRYSERSGYSVSNRDITQTVYYEDSLQRWDRTIVTQSEISFRGSVTADIKPPQFRVNPVTTAWELVPYSFVVDWLVDIGSALEAASFLTLQEGYTASTGYKIVQTRTWTDKFTDKNSGDSSALSVTNSPKSEDKFEVTNRTPSSVSIKPQLGLDVDFLKGVDLLGLLRQRFK